MTTIDLLVTGIGTLLTPTGRSARTGAAMRQLLRIDCAAVAVQSGVITDVGTEQEVLQRLQGATILQTLDLGGRLVTPGLVDPHTHLVHAGSREHESALKRAGVPYLEILKQGGGILSTVRSTRGATQEELLAQARKSLDEMLLQGVTTVEAKSGYGLTTEDEIKQLQVAKALNETHEIDVVSTFMGAHAIPPEYQDDPDGYVQLIIRDMLPKVAPFAEFCDVFCEKGVFTAEQSHKILEAARTYGMSAKIHADEIEALGGTRVAGQVGAITAEHLLVTGDEGMQALHEGGVIPVLLPGTSFNLGVPAAPARDMIDRFDLPVAIATDYNPGSCPTESLQLIMTLASLHLKMKPEEILTATTLNAACALKRGHQIGTIEVGKIADLAVFDAPNLEYIPYHFGINHTFAVIKKGTIVVWEKKRVS